MCKSTIGYALVILGALATVCKAVKITKFNVPDSFIIADEENPGELILDCEYEIEPSENGIVLKWLLNGSLIYQWLPEETPPPHTFTNMRYYINTNYTASNNEMQKHRALAIVKPMKNMTGEYSCQVGSYKADVKQSNYLQMIVPESDFKLNVKEPDNSEGDEESLSIECIAKNVYPEPILTIIPDDDKFVSRSKYDPESGLYSTTIFATIRTNQTNFNCLLNITGTNYVKSTNNSAKVSILSSIAPSAGSHKTFLLYTLIPLAYYTTIQLFNGKLN